MVSNSLPPPEEVRQGQKVTNIPRVLAITIAFFLHHVINSIGYTCRYTARYRVRVYAYGAALQHGIGMLAML